MKNLILMLLMGVSLAGYTQEFVTPTYTFSHKKTSYITLKGGKEVKGTVKKISIKKGLIEEIKIEDGSGKKVKIKPEEIIYMYLPPSGIDKLGKINSLIGDATKWNDQKLNQDLLNQNYAFFESTKVKIKKKEFTLMMQLLYTSFSSEVKVYCNPMATETASFGIAGVDVAGGNAKSYYVKVKDGVAFKLAKKTYDEEYVPMWKSCPSLMGKKDNIKWTKLNEHILEYSECISSKADVKK